MKRVTGSGIVGGRRRLEDTALRRYRLLLVIPILALVLQACGTRLPNSAFVNAGRGSSNGTGIGAGDETSGDQSANGGTTGDQGTAGGLTGGGATGGPGAGKTNGPSGPGGGGGANG